MSKIKEGNGILNFIYRIFVGADEIETDEPLKMDSKDPIEQELAKSNAKIEAAMNTHFTGGKGKEQFKVEPSQLNKQAAIDGKAKKATKQIEQEADRDAR